MKRHHLLQFANVFVFSQLEPVFMFGPALWSPSEVPEAELRGGEANLGEGWEGHTFVEQQQK